MNEEELLNKIQSKGYWRVEITPKKFEKLRIDTLSNTQELVKACVVTLRGWDYPHWNQQNVKNREDWVESWEDWTEYIEYWRFYRSAKFVHLFALHEDHMNMEKVLPIRFPPRPKHAGYLSFVSATFQITEIFEFAARLASKGVFSGEVFISIGLHNIEDHQLISFEANRWLEDNYVYDNDSPIIIEKEYPEQDLLEKGDELARDYVIEIFEQFQWNNPSRQMLSEDQKKLRS